MCNSNKMFDEMLSQIVWSSVKLRISLADFENLEKMNYSFHKNRLITIQPRAGPSKFARKCWHSPNSYQVPGSRGTPSAARAARGHEHGLQDGARRARRRAAAPSGRHEGHRAAGRRAGRADPGLV